MAVLETAYMGLTLKNPLIVGACGLTSHIPMIQKMERAGVAAIVTKSLFEEQAKLEGINFSAALNREEDPSEELLSLLSRSTDGAAEHFKLVRETKRSVSIPVIASLNAVTREAWVDYARRLEDCGVDGLELNLYSGPLPWTEGLSEEEQLGIVTAVREAVSLPVGVKLSPYYTNVLRLIRKLDEEEIDGFVLFSRPFQSDIDPVAEEHIFPFTFSQKTDSRIALRFAGLLFGSLNGKLCSSTGILDGEDVIKMILAGADAVQIVSTLYRHSIFTVETILEDLVRWMELKGYRSLQEFRGKMSRAESGDPWLYTRSQYTKLFMKPFARSAGDESS
jgi:dihydroorotate dehydrogenase (fumarate)